MNGATQQRRPPFGLFPDQPAPRLERRATMLPQFAVRPLQAHLQRVPAIHPQDSADVLARRSDERY